jgi:D-amino-acid dehydrogenase
MGWNVTLIERDTIGSGASHGNCGYVCPSHALPMAAPGMVSRTLGMLFKKDAALAIPFRFDPGLWKWFFKFSRECKTDRVMRAAVSRNALLASSMKLYRDFLQAENIDCEWTDNGLLLVYRSQREFDEYAATAEMLKAEFQLDAIPYAGSAVNELEPTLRDGMAGGWHFTGDAHVRPDRLIAGLTTAIKKRGVETHEHVEVLELVIEAGKQKAIRTSIGDMTADLFVLATGAEAPRFAKPLGCRIPIQPGKGYSLTMAPLKTPPKIPMIFEDHHVAVTPLRDEFRVGSTMEFTGYDRKLNRKRLSLLRRSAEEHLVEALPENVNEEWTGWRPMVYDGLPCIGPAPAASNVIVAAGNGMIGLASAPATGKLVAELASDVTPHIDAGPYSLDRF